MTSLGCIRAFSYEQTTFTYADVIDAAVRWGEYARLERSLSEPRTSAERLREAVIAFRRDRGLLAADDYRRWLEARSLTVADVDAHLLGAPRAVETEAILGGALHAWAQRLSRCAAAMRALGGDLSAAPLSELLAAEDRFRTRVLIDDRLERALAGHRQDWQLLRWRALELPFEDAAREAALLVREQGMPMSEVATLAHIDPHERAAYCEDVPEVSAALMGAGTGEIVGPLRVGTTWLVVELLERVPPSLSDPWIREHAEREVLDDALERHLPGRVRWHVEL